jgi:hypothetical protein
LLDTPVAYRPVPELSRLDLYKEFDVDSTAVIAAPTAVKNTTPFP